MKNGGLSQACHRTEEKVTSGITKRLPDVWWLIPDPPISHLQRLQDLLCQAYALL